MNTDSPIGRVPEGPTGRQIITVRPGRRRHGHPRAARRRRLRRRHARGRRPGSRGEGDVYLDVFGIAIVDSAPEQLGALSRAVGDSASPILAVEPEVYVYPFDAIDAAGGVRGRRGRRRSRSSRRRRTSTPTPTPWGLKAVHAVPPILATAPWAGADPDRRARHGHRPRSPRLRGRGVASSRSSRGPVQDGHWHALRRHGGRPKPSGHPAALRRRARLATARRQGAERSRAVARAARSWRGIQWAIQQGAT